MSVSDLAQHATPRDGGWFYAFPNGFNVLVLPCREAMRFETRVSGDWEVMELHGDAVRALRPQRRDVPAAEVESLLVALAALPPKES